MKRILLRRPGRCVSTVEAPPRAQRCPGTGLTRVAPPDNPSRRFDLNARRLQRAVFVLHPSDADLRRVVIALKPAQIKPEFTMRSPLVLDLLRG